MADVTSPTTATRPLISFGAWLGVVLLFLFFGIFVFVLVAATPHGNNYEQKRAEARKNKLNDARNAATKELNSYAWVDKGKGVARIPIDRAMQLTLRDLASKKPEPANPIATPAEAAAPAASPPAPAVSPAASPSATAKPKALEGPESENRNQPAAAGNPPNAISGTQPGPGATPGASASPASEQHAVSPSPMPEQNPPGTPASTPAKSPP
jgi:pilus assembly protein FimV